MLKRIVLVSLFTASGCDYSFNEKVGRYTYFDTSDGNLYKLDTANGQLEIISSPNGIAKLIPGTFYEDEDGHTYLYQGTGNLMELNDGNMKNLSDEQLLDLLKK